MAATLVKLNGKIYFKYICGRSNFTITSSTKSNVCRSICQMKSVCRRLFVLEENIPMVCIWYEPTSQYNSQVESLSDSKIGSKSIFGLVGGKKAELCWINWFCLDMWRQRLTWLKKLVPSGRDPAAKKVCPQLFMCPLRKTTAVLFCTRCPLVHVDTKYDTCKMSKHQTSVFTSLNPFYPLYFTLNDFQ